MRDISARELKGHNILAVERFQDNTRRMIEFSRPLSLPKSHPCYGCGNYGQPCVGVCHREMERWLKKRRKTNHEAGNR